MPDSDLATLNGLTENGFTHRVDRVLSFFSRRPHWDSPAPSRRRVFTPPLFGTGRPGGTLACGRENGGGGPNSDEGTDNVVL